MIKLVVFDWNGTLLADTVALVAGVNARLKYMGYPEVSIQKYREFFKIPASEAYKNLGIDEEKLYENIEEHSAIFHKQYEASASKNRTRAGTRQVLQFLHDANITSIILSNHNVKAITMQLERLKIEKYFDTILANSDLHSAYLKGKKDRLVEYLSNQDFKPNEVLIIGDTEEEIEIGKELGLHTVGITGGSSTAKRLKSAHPDVLIHKLHDLIDIVGEIK